MSNGDAGERMVQMHRIELLPVGVESRDIESLIYLLNMMFVLIYLHL